MFGVKRLILSVFFLFWTLFSAGQGWEWLRGGLKHYVVNDKNGGVYNLAASIDSFNIRKYDGSGTLEWEKVLKGNFSSIVCEADLDGNLLIGGSTSSVLTSGNLLLPISGKTSFFLIKYAPNSTILASKIFGSSGETSLNCLYVTKDNHLLIGGSFKDTTIINGFVIPGDTFYNAFFAEMDSQFNVLWGERTKCISGQGEVSLIDEIAQSESGNYYLAVTFQYCLISIQGYSITQSSGKYLVKLDSARNVMWASYIDYPGFYSTTTDLQILNDTAYMKNLYHHHGSGAFSLFRWNPDGTKIDHGFAANNLAYGIFNGKIYYAYASNLHSSDKPRYDRRNFGVMSSNFKIVRQYTDTLIFPDLTFYEDLRVKNENEMYVCGYGEQVSTRHFVGKFRYDIASGLKETSVNDLKLYPNPASTQITMEFEASKSGTALIFNSTGEEIYRQVFSNDKNEIEISSLRPGIYILRVIVSNKTVTRKFIKN